ncbi:MAG: DNA translocase FtsK [Verrucomicrobiae bacterium]|nr:DNA translocase FtsK [Verrucomicrobiae bacterium]
MARNEHGEPAPNRGFNDIIGIALLAAALLLMAAQWSFDRGDVRYLRVPPHDPAHNWIGPAGAYVAWGTFLLMGGAAYILPMLLMFFGLGYLWDFMAYLRRKWWTWAAAGVVLLCCTGLLNLYTDGEMVRQMATRRYAYDQAGFLEKIAFNIGADTAGGLLGLWLNQYAFGHFGRAGATIIYCTLYCISLYFLTNFELGNWVREWLQKRREADLFAGLTEPEKELKRKALELERRARELEQEVERSARGKAAPAAAGAAANGKAGPELGADLQPVPEPTVRDLSVPQIKSPSRKSKEPVADAAAKEEPAEAAPPAAKVVPAATTADILGKDAALPARGKAAPEAAPAAAAAAAPAVAAKAAEPAAKVTPQESWEPVPSSAAREPEKENPFAAPAAAMAALPAATPAKPKPAPRKSKPIAVAEGPHIGNYRLPPLDLLQLPDLSVKPSETKEELMANAQLMKNTLAQFDIEVAIGDITKGPTITRYELHPAPGVKLEKITALTNNIAAALKAERIHILAPVPGKSSVGVEVPNAVKTKVTMRELLESEEWTNTKARIPLALGKDVYGHPIIADLADMPHLLIAGSTGSGKSVCINAIVASLLYRFSPDQLRFVMIDPKVVELQHYNALPHLVVPVVNDPKKVILALRWVINEMEKRYKIFAKVGVRNIKSFNDRPRHKPPPAPSREQELPLIARKEKVEAGAEGFAVEVDEEIVVPREDDIIIPEKLSYIVVIIDELADLMLVAPADVEMAIARITQMARAAGIHCIVATQRPSVDVITGVIKANIPARIAFQVAAKVDSRTILDAMGADKLLGKGDMLYLPPGSAKLIRAQGALITDQEIQSIVDFIGAQGKPSYDLEITQQLSKPTSSLDEDAEASDEDEELIQQCIEVIRSEQKASVSLLQRRLKLGYGRAARLMDELERRGIVGPSKGAEPRDILIDLDGTGMDGAKSAGGPGLTPA